MKKIIILIAGLLTGICAAGQVENDTDEQIQQKAKSKIKHEFSIYGGGGISTLLYDFNPVVGTQSDFFGGILDRLGGFAGLGYTIFFNEYFGIGTGAEITFYNAKLNSASFSSENPAVDFSGNTFLFMSRNLENFEEKQMITSINVPLMFNVQSGGYHRFYFTFGAKIGIPVPPMTNFKSSAGKITTSGYYEYENFEYTDMEFLGFKTFQNGADGEGKLKLKLAYLVSAEFGMKWGLGKNVALYTGFYADYGFSDIIEKREGGIAVYNTASPEKVGFNSILSSQHRKSNGNIENLVDKVSPLSGGIKIKLAFGKGINRDKKKIINEEKQDKDKDKQKDNTEAIDSTELINARLAAQQAEEALRAERELYLKNAAERRQKYKQALGDVDQYGLSIVTLNAAQKKTLNTYIEEMKKDPDISLYITGHTCDIGSEAINIQIGQERADVAKDYMVEEGISPSRIRTFSMGKSKPLVPNTSEANRKKNRRLEIQVVQILK